MRVTYSTTWLLLLNLSFTYAKQFNYSDSWEAELQKALFENRRIVQPTAHFTDPIQISVDINPLFLKELNAAMQTFSLIATLYFVWEDRSLSWDPASYGNATVMYVPSSWVWRPNFGVASSVDQNVFDADAKDKNKVALLDMGMVIWFMSETFTTSCAIDALRFPFDTQTCVLSITNWGASEESENYTGLPVSYPEDFLTGNKWELQGMDVEDTCDTEYEYPMCKVDYIFTFKRKPDFYVLSMIVPLMVLSFLGLLVFPLPADSGDKVALGITVVLSFAVMETSVREYLPPSFPSIPYIVSLMFTMLMFNALSLTVTIIVIVVCLKKPYRKVPKWLDRYVTPKGDQSKAVTVPSVRNIAVIEEENIYHIEPPGESAEGGKDSVKSADKDSEEELKEKWERVADLVNKICFVVFCVAEGAILGIIYVGWFFL